MNPQQESNLPPGLSRPAQRALTNAGYRRLEQLARVSEAEVEELHGVGPKALAQLQHALVANGLSFRRRSVGGRP
jgi:predicted RecB family nuclease